MLPQTLTSSLPPGHRSSAGSSLVLQAPVAVGEVPARSHACPSCCPHPAGTGPSMLMSAHQLTQVDHHLMRCHRQSLQQSEEAYAVQPIVTTRRGCYWSF